MQLNLNGYTFQELFTPAGLKRLDDEFLCYLKSHEPALEGLVLSARLHTPQTNDYNNLILALAPHLEHFLVSLFGISADADRLLERVLEHDPVLRFKTQFVLKQVRRALKRSEEFLSFDELHQSLISILGGSSNDLELQVCQWGLSCLKDPEHNESNLQLLLQWSVQALATHEGRKQTAGWVCFKLPQKLNFVSLVPVEGVPHDEHERLQAPTGSYRHREGFELTDKRMGLREVMGEVEYCVYCHEKEGDFCSTGFPVKKGKPELGLKRSPLNEVLTGCPLEEKISQMHWLKKQGLSIAALATVMIDNPMCPATGHRICNDCMNACIYQKQDPVDIPQIETRVLTDVLSLSWGVELYDLLTRWNPLRLDQFVLQPYNGRKVLIMGMGPAGFTLAHHLLMAGFAVVGCDGLKIEPLDDNWLNQPILNYESLEESLATRVNMGFGGVAEYGITPRWDKNFLKLIFISLKRKSHFQCFGSVRFGGAITVDQAWELGFDHLAIAVGAGLPRELVLPNSLAPGMRQANDFLMALQLTGAGKVSSLANLQVRMPAVVIGGGLTGIDAATEVQAYYFVLIQKVFDRYTALSERFTEETVRQYFDDLQLEVIDEYISHAKQLNQERLQASQENREVNFIGLSRRWGGVTVVYRRSIQESPAYRLNHEELAKALEEGLYYAEGLSPNKVILDQYGYAKALECQMRLQNEDGLWMQSDQVRVLPARCILVATGAKPNVAYEFEHRGTFLRKGFEYQRFDWVESELKQNTDNLHVKIKEVGPFTSYDDGCHTVSLLGDTHSVFHGNVVNAIASAKRIYPDIIRVISDRMDAVSQEEVSNYSRFNHFIHDQLTPRVVGVEWVEPGWCELTVRAPLAALSFQPGQFYRLQTYESLSGNIDGTSLHSEALALLAIGVPDEPEQLKFIFETKGVSSQLLARLKPLDRLSVMGPTGNAIRLPESSTVLVVGGMMAFVQLRALAPALKQQGNKIVFVAVKVSSELLNVRQQLESVCDSIIWCDPLGGSWARSCDWITSLGPVKACVSAPDAIATMISEAVQVMVVGDAALIKTIQTAREAAWGRVFSSKPAFVAAVHGPMQCMLKGVCAQCLQWQIDPATGKRTKAVYACSWHNQPLEMVDSGNLDERLHQNSAQETLSRMWFEHLQTLEMSERCR